MGTPKPIRRTLDKVPEGFDKCKIGKPEEEYRVSVVKILEYHDDPGGEDDCQDFLVSTDISKPGGAVFFLVENLKDGFLDDLLCDGESFWPILRDKVIPGGQAWWIESGTDSITPQEIQRIKQAIKCYVE